MDDSFPPACLLRLLLTAGTFAPSRQHYQTDVERHALSSYATVATRRQPRAACVTVPAPVAAALCGMTITLFQFACSGKRTVFQAVPLSMSIALGNQRPSAFFLRRDFDGPCATTFLNISLRPMAKVGYTRCLCGQNRVPFNFSVRHAPRTPPDWPTPVTTRR